MLSPLIYELVNSTNEIVRDTNKVVQVLQSPEQEKHDVFVIEQMTKQFDRKILEMRDDPAKFEAAVRRAEERLK